MDRRKVVVMGVRWWVRPVPLESGGAVRRLVAGFPATRLALSIAWRGLILWLLVRGAVRAVRFAPDMKWPEAVFLGLTPSAALGVIMVVAGLGMLESRRLNEHRFHANLGVSPLLTLLLVVLPAICGEILLGVTVRP